MRQEEVISVSDNVIYTTSGPKRPIGNRMFREGDWIWCDDKAAFGHQTGGGVVPVEIGGIPIVSTGGGILL